MPADAMILFVGWVWEDESLTIIDTLDTDDTYGDCHDYI